ncbi:MAG: putative Ig domain-containing protein [bacterium]
MQKSKSKIFLIILYLSLNFAIKSYASPIKISAPWTAGEVWVAGEAGGGSFYGQDYHIADLFYAIDFNLPPSGADDGKPIRAVANGIISYANEYGNYGWLVKIFHGNSIESRYAHLKYDPKVDPGIKVGQKIFKGEIIGKCGSSSVGNVSTGSHLHFELRQNNITIEPNPMDGQTMANNAWITSYNSPISWHPDATLVKIPNDGNPATTEDAKVYLLWYGYKCYIPNDDVFKSQNYDSSKIIVISQTELNGYPDGNNITKNNSPNTFFKYTFRILFLFETTEIWMVDDSENPAIKRPVPHEKILESWGHKLNEIPEWTTYDYFKYSTGKEPVFLRDGTLIKGDGSKSQQCTNTIYVIENGRRRLFEDNDLFLALGYKQEDVIEIPDSALEAGQWANDDGDLITLNTITSAPRMCKYIPIDISNSIVPEGKITAGTKYSIPLGAFKGLFDKVTIWFTSDNWCTSIKLCETALAAYEWTPDDTTGSGAIRITANNSNNEFTDSYSNNFKIISPSANINITSPANNATISDTTIISVSINNFNTYKVNYYLDSSKAIAKTANVSPFNWTCNTKTISNGSHSITAVACDFIGNETHPAAIQVTVNNISNSNNPPNIPSPLKQYKGDGSTVIGFNKTTDERNVIFKANVSDPDNNPVSLEVEVKLVGISFTCSPNGSSSGTVSSGGIANANYSGLVDGQYHWQARTKDSKGDFSSWKSAGGGNLESEADFIVSAASTPINYPPAVTLISPNGGETLVVGSSHTVKWIATDEQELKIGLYYSVDGGSSWAGIPGAALLSNTGNYAWTIPDKVTSSAQISAIATDGITSMWDFSNSNFSIVKNSPAPSKPVLQNITASDNDYTVSWSASNNAISYTLQQNNSSVFNNPATIYIGKDTYFNFNDKATGTYYYRVKAFNSDGIESGWSDFKNVTIQENQKPGEITASCPLNNSTDRDLDITLSWNVNHPGRESLRYNVYIASDEIFNIFNPIYLKSSGQTQKYYSLSSLPYHTKIYWAIEAIDDSGDRKQSDRFSFTTLGDNTKPTGSILVNNGATSTSSYSVTLNLTATDSSSGVKNMRLSNNGNNWTNWVNYTTEYSWNLADQKYGSQPGLSSYTVYVKYRDEQNNESDVYSDTITKGTGTPGLILLNGETYQTIQDAIDAASSGDTVYLTEGYYSVPGSYHPELPNYSSRELGLVMRTGITLMGTGADKTTIDVSGNVTAGILDADNSVVEGLTIINSSSYSSRIVILIESDSSIIRNCIIKGGMYGIHIGHYTSASNCEILNNLIINNENGVRSHLSNNFNISLFNNTITNSNTNGFVGWLNPIQLVNNIITNNSVGIYVKDNPSIFQNNNIYDNSSKNYNDIADQTNINGNISSDPLLTGDYHLNSSSPCINAGTDVGIPYSGSKPDMGAFEYSGTGNISVTSNRTDASFTIKGPSGTYIGSGTNWETTNLPLGIYTITFSPITNCYSPSYQVKTLYSGQTLVFDGTYNLDDVGPQGTIAVNFEEYATADKLVTITFDISDEVGGIDSTSQMMFSNDGVEWSPAESYSSIKKNWDLTIYGGDSDSGLKTVYAKVSDSLSNWSTLTDTILYVPNRQVLEVPTQYNKIQSAMDEAQDGDMVYVLPGTYTAETINLKQGVRLQGAGPAMVSLQNLAIGVASIRMASNSMVDGFTSQSPIDCTKCNFTIISNNMLKRLISTGGDGRQIVRNNLIKSSIYISGCSASKGEIIVENNTLSNNTGTALTYAVTDLFTDIKVYLKNNVIAYNNTGLSDNGSDKAHQHIFPSFNTYWNNTNNFSGNISKMGPGDISSDPKFVDTANNNYHLQTGSDSINSGDFDDRYNDTDGSRNDRGTYGGPALNTAPKADFSINPPQGGTGTLFTFDASLSHDTESEYDQLQVRWDFDGDEIYDSEFSSDKISTHKYSSVGTYNARLEVKDNKGFISTVIKTVNVTNRSPNAPSNPMPEDGSTGKSGDITLLWTSGDPDINDTVTYNVYFGKFGNPPLISAGQNNTYFNPGTLDNGCVYYWKIEANDNHNASNESPVWYFVTGTLPAGSISINNGDTYTNSISVILKLFATDNDGIVKKMCFSNDNVNWSALENYSTTKQWNLATGNGIKTVYVKFKNNNDSWSMPYSDAIILDVSQPDTAPPSPNSFASLTYETTRVFITSNTAYDSTPPVYYKIESQFFNETAWTNSEGGVSNYEFSDNRPVSWVDDNLLENSLYRYRQIVKDSSNPPNYDTSVWYEIGTLSNPSENQPPILNPIGNKTIDEGESLEFVITATDPDGDNLSFTISNIPTGAEFDALTQTFKWTPNYGQTGNYPNMLFTVTDNGTPPASDFEFITITVGDVNRPPILEQIGDKIISEGTLLEFPIKANDPDDGDELTYTASNLPIGAEFDIIPPTFSWTPDYGQARNYPDVLFTVTDNGTPPESDSESITITVGNVNRPPKLNPIGNKIVNEGEVLQFTITGQDEDGDKLNYTANNLPPYAVFYSTAQIFVWSPNYNQAGNYESISFTVTDNGMPPESDSEAIIITVGDVNRPPVLNPIGDKSVKRMEKLAFSIIGSDPDGDTLTYSASNLPEGAYFIDQTFTWEPDFDQSGIYKNIKFEATDGMDSSNETITITVIKGKPYPKNIKGETGNAQVKLSWEFENNYEAQGYNLYRREENNNLSKINAEIILDTVYTDTSVYNHKKYYYCVTAVDYADEESDYSYEIEAIPHYPEIAPISDCDINKENKLRIIDGRDINTLFINFGREPDNSKWNPAVDINKDGIVDGIDLSLLGENFGVMY